MAIKFSEMIDGTRNTRRSARRPNQLLYLMLGVFVLGILPAPAEGLAFDSQAQKTDAGTTASVKKPIKINAAPFKAFLIRSKKLNEQGKLDLSQPRAITVDVDRNEDGTVTNAVITGQSAADPNFRKVAQDFVSSLNESRALSFLEGVSHVRMSFQLEGERFRMRSDADAPSETRAEEMARGYRSMINLARIFKRGGDEAVVLNNMKISASGKQLVMNLDMPREAMGNILIKQITPN
jgi:hypothetical protein